MSERQSSLPLRRKRTTTQRGYPEGYQTAHPGHGVARWADVRSCRTLAASPARRAARRAAGAAPLGAAPPGLPPPGPPPPKPPPPELAPPLPPPAPPLGPGDEQDNRTPGPRARQRDRQG